ncbi:MAG: hypothetical protein KGZ83_18605 [Sulfuricella sp.]|nr:hypothetical protein [Sulfuricella sp.]
MKKLTLTACLIALLPATACASELVYVPINPSFGGNPLNGAVLMGNAQAQDTTTPPATAPTGAQAQTALQQFNDMLQRVVLNSVATSLTGNIIGPSGKLLPGTVQTKDFSITIQDLGGGSLKVTTTDKTTGSFTSFQVAQ